MMLNINYALPVALVLIPNLLIPNVRGLDWSQCAIDANQSYWKAPNDTFLYDQYGKPTTNFSQAWGISYESCKAICGTPVNAGGYDWNPLSQGLTSWLLPWLALTAQLPFETKDKQTNFMALLLALGSPSLITFSLALTILNARWINQNFRQIKEDTQNLRPSRPLQTKAINSLWIWMIPIVLGWVYVGTQTSAGSIKAAIASTNVPILGPERDVTGECIGIRDRTTFDESFTSFLGFSIAGCELEPGPIFNYARIWSHMNAVQHVVEAFSAVTRRQQAKKTVHGRSWNDELKRYDENLRGSPQELSKYISIHEYGEDKPNFSIHGRGSSKLVLNCIAAAFVTIVLQWGSTGAAMVIGYRTPVVGLGCQSGSYLMYGLVSTVAWLTLALSASLSNRWSLQMDMFELEPHDVLGPLAVVTRLVGKSLAAGNALFLVATPAIQFTGLYDTCWCDACIPSLGRQAGWVILFATDAQIAAASKGAWIGGVSMSVLAAAFTTLYFLTSRGDEVFKRNIQ